MRLPTSVSVSFFPSIIPSFLAHFSRIILCNIHSLLSVSHLEKKRKKKKKKRKKKEKKTKNAKKKGKKRKEKEKRNNWLDALPRNESIALYQQSLRFAYDESTSAFHSVILILRIVADDYRAFLSPFRCRDFQLAFSKSS
jgi:flagellar biosynthesis component FlhA